jgi:hypothetical protein
LYGPNVDFSASGLFVSMFSFQKYDVFQSLEISGSESLNFFKSGLASNVAVFAVSGSHLAVSVLIHSVSSKFFRLFRKSLVSGVLSSVHCS